jgi:leucyl aminopeptidase
MTSLSVLLLAAGFWGAVFAFKNMKKAKHPQRLFELENALQNHADLAMYRNQDPETAQELEELLTHLKSARGLVNAPTEAVSGEWRTIRRSLLHLTSEPLLKRVDLFYTDRRDDIKAAVYALISAVDKRFPS